jgi:hypothetical protein
VKFDAGSVDERDMADHAPPMPRDIAAELVARCGEHVLFLRHRRRQRRGQQRQGLGSGTISLIAVAASAVYVVGTPEQVTEIRPQRERGRTIEVLLFRDADPAPLLMDLHRQLTAVRFALADRTVVARSMLCLRPQAGSLLGSPTVAGVPLLSPIGATRVLTSPGQLDGPARQALYERLAHRLPPT